jgi:hypothetical protein
MSVSSGVVVERDQAQQAATGVRQRRRWPWLVLSLAWVLIVSCAAVPVVYVVAPAVLGTWTADHGEGSPRAALAAFVYSFNDGPDATGVDRLIVPEQRRAIGGQRRDYLATMAVDMKTTGWSGVFETAGPQPTDHTDVRGDRAVVMASYRVRWKPPPVQQTPMTGDSVVWYDGQAHPWRAEARKDRTGWRLWSMTIPPWCGTHGYSRCVAVAPWSSSTPSQSPSPSASAEDPLDGVRSMLPYGPADPLRQYHDCPTPEPS